MCRHLAYVGDPLPLGRLLKDPPHSLFHQSWEPAHQRSGTVNADGFGVGWYADGDPVPARYRRAGPIWADLSFTDLARVVRTRALLAAVRDATLPSADGEAAAAPFASGTWLFSHNGAVKSWPRSVSGIAATLPPADLLSLEARTDSAFVWALVLQRLKNRRPLGDALAGALAEVAAAAPGSRLNLLATDGSSIAATVWGDSLWYLLDPGRHAVVASEPYDDDPAWREVPDATLLTATRTEVLLTPLKDVTAPKEPRP
ncbi:ergothioneine biosynthesis protein EgtC [Streptomyces roseirectus]|uniref:Gamma-glutamyl-hercynylcysteine sulfoxide hydrolase n=1 Tax=Streptomyces roseirectus TaxID=2768066 RepID=A0A7H0IN42_9ACTN|nr:ergothioneine biosynthesis protein EgtC [Streptomyces roseirectus]QNP74208.1 ergothioneine biosynthesis protein EgtC [Streptomyces roseirectus]